MAVPKLRFKEFNDEWKAYKFYDVVTIINGQVDPNDKMYRNLPHIGPGNIEKGTGRLLKYNLAKDDNLISSKYLFDENSVIYGKINPHFAKVCYPNFIGLCSADTYPINPNNSLLTSQFLLCMLLTKKFTKFAISVSMRTGMPKINRDELGIYKFTIPSIKEQEKVGNLISLLDRKIDIQYRKIEALKIYKTGLINKIFKENNKISKQYKISDCINIYDKRTTINNQFTILSSTKDGIKIQDDYFNRQTASENNIGYKIIPRNYITYRSMSDTGNFYFNIQNIIDTGIVSPAYPVFKTIHTVDTNYFINYLNSSSEFKSQILINKEGGTRFALGISKLLNLYIKLPEYQTQIYYSAIITNINSKIINEEKKLSNFNNLKKSLLQQMFI